MADRHKVRIILLCQTASIRIARLVRLRGPPQDGRRAKERALSLFVAAHWGKQRFAQQGRQRGKLLLPAAQAG